MPGPYVQEPSRRIPVRGEYDVAVVGGGIAGVAAAVAAARNGASVCLLENQFALGGLATLGIVTVYLPLCDGRGRQVVGGLGEELLKLSVADGSCEAIPACWRRGGDKARRARQRYRVRFNPASFLLALEALVLRSGVELMYGTRFCRAVRRGRRVSAVVVENKSGRSALRCGTVVDATGDADVCAATGEATVSLKTNVAGGWFYTLDGDGRGDLIRFTLPFDQTGCTVPEGGGRGFAGDNAKDATGQVIDTRRAILRRLAELRDRQGGGPLHPLIVPTLPTFRMTRRLKKASELSVLDDRRTFPDTIGMIGSWLSDGRVFTLPFRALAAEKTDNLLVAGRCISVDETAWVYTRAIPACAVTGEAAGTAAAMAARADGRFASVEIGALQRQLRKQKVILRQRGLRPEEGSVG